MRPLHLRLRGFTAFREEQRVDFQRLGIFAVSGPTGSGKTSLLEALTYALYGEVERVGVQCAQLISQGLPRMSVELDFQVGNERYRIARSTTVGGQSKVLLQRLVDGQPQGFGDGADRVRDCRALVEKLIGLDYTEFTRSVLLPQGRFAEFLAGKPEERRRILTDLLDLSLFRRMADVAGQQSRDARSEAAARQTLIDSEYAGVTEIARDAMRGRADAARQREKTLLQAKAKVDQITDRWRELERSAIDLRRCAEEVADLASAAASAETSLRSSAKRMAGIEKLMVARQASARELRGAAVEAARAREARERAWGSRADLETLLTRAEALRDLRKELDRAGRDLVRRRSESAQFAEAAKASTAAAKAAGDALAVAEASLASAEKTYDGVQHEDLVASVSAGLKRGDPCPICGMPLARAPRRAAPRLAPARESLDGARKARERAAAQRERRNLELSEAKRDLAEANREVERLTAEIAQRGKALEATERAIAAVVKGNRAEEALATLRARVGELKSLAASELSADRDAADAERLALETERDRLKVAQEITDIRARLADPAHLLRRAKELAGSGWSPPAMPSTSTAMAETGAVVESVAQHARVLKEVAESLQAMLRRRLVVQPGLLEEAHAAVAGLVPPTPSLAKLADAVTAAVRASVDEAARLQAETERITERLGRLDRLVAEARALAQRADLFGALAADLRAPNIIEFLQEEALRALAAAGSTHLMQLSNARYRLSSHDGEFHAIDAWNTDEERSVRTLSGGETFLASLALALALADQVRSLAVSERARLDSLFLDEGFGTLDADSLRAAVEAIQQLGSTGRLVGIVTHVREVAEQFDCIEVEKSARGSHITTDYESGGTRDGLLIVAGEAKKPSTGSRSAVAGGTAGDG